MSLSSGRSSSVPSAESSSASGFSSSPFASPISTPTFSEQLSNYGNRSLGRRWLFGAGLSIAKRHERLLAGAGNAGTVPPLMPEVAGPQSAAPEGTAGSAGAPPSSTGLPGGMSRSDLKGNDFLSLLLPAQDIRVLSSLQGRVESYSTRGFWSRALSWLTFWRWGREREDKAVLVYGELKAASLVAEQVSSAGSLNAAALPVGVSVKGAQDYIRDTGVRLSGLIDSRILDFDIEVYLSGSMTSLLALGEELLSSGDASASTSAAGSTFSSSAPSASSTTAGAEAFSDAAPAGSGAQGRTGSASFVSSNAAPASVPAPSEGVRTFESTPGYNDLSRLEKIAGHYRFENLGDLPLHLVDRSASSIKALVVHLKGLQASLGVVDGAGPSEVRLTRQRLLGLPHKASEALCALVARHFKLCLHPDKNKNQASSAEDFQTFDGLLAISAKSSGEGDDIASLQEETVELMRVLLAEMRANNDALMRMYDEIARKHDEIERGLITLARNNDQIECKTKEAECKTKEAECKTKDVERKTKEVAQGVADLKADVLGAGARIDKRVEELVKGQMIKLRALLVAAKAPGSLAGGAPSPASASPEPVSAIGSEAAGGTDADAAGDAGLDVGSAVVVGEALKSARPPEPSDSGSSETSESASSDDELTVAGVAGVSAVMLDGVDEAGANVNTDTCLLYTSPSPRDS